MIAEVISGLIASITAAHSYDILKIVLEQFLARKNIVVNAKDKEELVIEILQKSDIIAAGETPEEASRTTREVVEKQVNILEQERNRLIPIASREHWAALLFAIFSGTVFIVAIVLAIQGSIQGAVVSLVASVIPGFLSKVFYNREEAIENRIKEISSDLRESEKVSERLELLEQALSVVPVENQNALVTEFNKKAFRK